MKLYHGTGAARLDAILKRGLRPRGSNAGNWEHSIESNPRAVYLTTAYAPYFALTAQKDDDAAMGLILEIESDRLDPDKLGADEDAVEQVMRRSPEDPLAGKGWGMIQRTRWFRKRVLDFRWQGSVDAMGTCCYVGVIRPEAITRYALVDFKKAPTFAWAMMDPIITILNYQLVGAKYRTATRWVFGEPPLEGDEAPLWPWNDEHAKLLPPQALVERDGIKLMASWWMPPEEERAAITLRRSRHALREMRR